MYTQLQENAFYVGSTERFSFTEAPDEKGMLEVSLGKKLSTRFIPLQTRAMADAPAIACGDKDLAAIHREIREAVRSIEPAEKIVRLSLAGLPAPLVRALDMRGIRELGKDAVHFEVKIGAEKPAEPAVLSSSPGSSLAAEFERFLQAQNIKDKEVILSLGLSYLRSASETEEAA